MMIDASVANNGLVMIIISVLQHVALATCVFIALQMVISKAKLQHGLLCNLIKYNIYIYTNITQVGASSYQHLCRRTWFPQSVSLARCSEHPKGDAYISTQTQVPCALGYVGLPMLP